MTATYVPGTLEQDQKKIIMSLQQMGPKIDTLNTNAATYVVGPNSSTNNGFAVYSGTSGKLIADHAATISLTLEVSGTLPVGNGGTGVANPSAHTIPVNNGSSAFNNTGTGTAGQYLGGNGASADPSFKSGAWTLLNTLTASNSATLSDTTSFTSSYNEYELVFEDIITATNATGLTLQVHSGGAFKNTGYLSSQLYSTGAASANTTLTTAIQIGGNNTTSSSIPSKLKVRVSNPTVSEIHAWEGTGFQITGTNPCCSFFGGAWNSAAAIDGFQVLALTGNITSGTVKVYGRL